MCMQLVVNINHTDDYDVYIGRGSIFGNHFKIGKDGSRKRVIERYKEYIINKIETDPIFKKEFLKLKNKKLGCYCKPQDCHGDVIVELLKVYYDEINKKFNNSDIEID